MVSWMPYNDNALILQVNKTALMYAAEGGHEAIFQSLVAAGCDINAKDRVRIMFFVVLVDSFRFHISTIFGNAGKQNCSYVRGRRRA